MVSRISNTNNIQAIIWLVRLFNQAIGLMSRVFANGPGDQGSIPGRVNLCGLFNAKAILVEEQQWYYLTHSWRDKEVHAFPKGINPESEHNSMAGV